MVLNINCVNNNGEFSFLTAVKDDNINDNIDLIKLILDYVEENNIILNFYLSKGREFDPFNIAFKNAFQIDKN
ncbi:hypothetical protein BCR32DRAFT_280861 [Anaeromyces robustus]|uniref:Uncharacterized protein n=1 Tax=Anaeromyces robustus TaxID=1754192 RepID=A0A1Y1X309_9FUNG|nr:hypothetical protein BCR32DRAFT_280861 [Anaeromyces robustus]|eukprot:ORX80082.1 hypothetical protein BCR32DRAFT_280861 [Anaeromyces robustus]